MKRKNILKFVSLLGIGSFVMVAAASCTSAATPTPNPEPKPNPNPEPKPDPMPNPPSGGMNGGDINPGGGQNMMDSAAQELTAARTALTSLLASKNANIEMYSDYAKIQNTLIAAYTTAEQTSQNSSATLEQVKNATSALQTAINTANSNKQKFDQDHSNLLMSYKNLMATLAKKETTVMTLKDPKYSAILDQINGVSSKGEELVQHTLDPVSGIVPAANTITEEITKIEEVISEKTLQDQKNNADQFANYQSFTLDKTKLENVEDAKKMGQPANYSFVGYSVDVTGTSGQETTIPNWNFAQRAIFTSGNQPTKVTATTTGEDQSTAKPLSDVSWIYSLAGTGAKYTLEFTYYGPSTGWLYFPYKLVKANDDVGLQYKLNSNETLTPIIFGEGTTTNGPAATVENINVAKVRLTGLAFGKNTIEFSAPMSKVAPMIGNMYLTSSDTETNKQNIENSIFGNSVTTENNITKISVDTLSAYSLASDWSTFIGQYSSDSLTLNGNRMSDQKYYLIGYVGGNTGQRDITMVANTNQQRLPTASNQNTRSYTLYVNAPKAGAYYIKGVFASEVRRDLKFSTGDMSSNNVTIRQLSTGNLTTLKTFDTSAITGPTRVTTVDTNRKTLTLVKGLNKIVVSGATADNGNAPNFGYLEFILNETQPETT
ncbi:VlhA.3.07 [Mycoplasmoides gallisepticum S6]|uniref:VlhA.3.07 n=1 Tax=Mycoplasmoides gallisepticum S6 TaxID=1006581 RepID=A0A0F6CLV9_MYCGL|nr:VlhA.3.07 [Mycoplasmoides gallisepticum S6]